MRDQFVSTLRSLSKTIGTALFGAFLAAIVAFVLFVDAKPDLSIWHTAELDSEFVEHLPVHDFAGYLELEEKLFAQLESRVFERSEPSPADGTNRYQRGSRTDPARWDRNWNRTYELVPRAPTRAGVLLLHGMSDSPYSLRGIAQTLHARGAHVVGLRIPGHGTAPVGLTEVRWQDMAAAVRLAAHHLDDAVGDHPLAIVGYSNGAALAVEYSLEALEDASLPRVEHLVLLSPEIGVSPAAVFAVWQKRLGRLLGLEKLEWNSVLPEYDPFKYQSFAINAGEQAYRLTTEIARRLQALRESKRLDDFPKVLAFQSAVDATVSTPAVIEGLMARLAPTGHELVLFDVNRMSSVEPLLRRDPDHELAGLLRGTLPFALSVVRNRDPSRHEVVLDHGPAGDSAMTTSDLGLAWPRDVFSLSHLALPFSASDPLYGSEYQRASPLGFSLGNLALRGESGALQITPAAMLRQRWNPFHSFMERRILELLSLE